MAFQYEWTENGLIVDDPIYGKFLVSNPYSKLIFTKEMKRLEDITQNGFSQYDYPGLANNERLSHSVGAFHNMEEIIKHLEEKLSHYGIKISQDDKDVALCSMLLHDIGHGPNSHSFEKTTHYSHEKRTVDILLGDTEIGQLLKETFGKRKLKKIASFIAEINDEEEIGKDSFTKLLKSLVSHQLDADRLDYLQRDSYHAGIPTAIKSENIINSLGVIVNENQEYELIVDKKGITSIETVLLERFQKYRDVYYTDSSIIMDAMFPKIVNLYSNNIESVEGEIPEQFRKLALDSQVRNLQDFLTMTDTPIQEALNIISSTSRNQLLRYLCKKESILDYQIFDTDKSVEDIIQKLEAIFGRDRLKDTISVFEDVSKIKLYKKDEGLKVNYGNRIVDLSDATNLIRPQEISEKRYLIFNSEILRLELGMTKIEFEQYKGAMEKMIRDINKKPEEFELKYIIEESNQGKIDILDIIGEFKKNGFEVIEEYDKENDDEYYDTKDTALLRKGGSLRIRKVTKNGQTKYKGTYKEPTGEGEVYSSREEYEEELNDGKIEELITVMSNKNGGTLITDVLEKPILNARTKRKDVVLERDGIKVCVSFDNTVYQNHALYQQKAGDTMIEIEMVGDVTERIVLNEINNFLKDKFSYLQLNKQSKYERGIRKTRILYKSELEKEIDVVEKSVGGDIEFE